jgi:hypothetical protein
MRSLFLTASACACLAGFATAPPQAIVLNVPYKEADFAWSAVPGANSEIILSDRNRTIRKIAM